jgi:hypothetical protein
MVHLLLLSSIETCLPASACTAGGNIVILVDNLAADSVFEQTDHSDVPFEKANSYRRPTGIDCLQPRAPDPTSGLRR